MMIRSITMRRCVPPIWILLTSIFATTFAPVQLMAQSSVLTQSVKDQKTISEAFATFLYIPPSSQSTSIGLTLKLEVIRWQLPGYGDVRMTLSASVPSATDENVVVRFDSSGDTTLPRNRGTIVDVPIDLAQGERTVVVDAAVPCYALCERIAVSVLQDGREVPGYTGNIQTQYGDRINPLLTYLATEGEISWQDGQQASRPDAGAADVLRIDDPSQVEDSTRLVDAIRRQLIGGGVVVSTTWMEPAQWSKMFNLSLSKFGRDRTLQDSASGVIEVFSVGPGQFLQPSQTANQTQLAKWQEDLPAMVANILPAASSPLVRRGMDPMMGDSRFSQWRVPGVAQPPVYTFMGLLAAFVVLVGPIAYRKTTRSGRGYMMFAIAPVLAMVTTISMFAYGIVADGFGTVVRIRQLTFVDGASGDAGERSRATYFAGIRPGGGIDFNRDWKVYPYPEPAVGQSWETLADDKPTLAGVVTIDEGHQNFDASFLPSRQQRQFVVEATRRSIGRLRIETQPPDDTKTKVVRLVNEFGFELRRVLVRDADGDYWIADKIPAGGSIVASQPTTDLPSMLMGNMYNDFWPISQVIQSRSANIGQRLDGTRDLVAVANGLVAAKTISVEGIFESTLLDLLKNDAALPLGYFVAMSDPSADMVGVEGAQVNESVRYVLGTMP